MSQESVVSGPITERDMRCLREAVCIQTEKIYDSCREKDCIEDATVLFRNPSCIKRLLNVAINVKCNRAEVIDVFADVEAVPFKKGFYTVDVKFFIRVVLNFFIPKCGRGSRVITIPGLVVFDKKVILFGSEGKVKIFKSHYTEAGLDTPAESSLQQDNLPISKVEVAEPICLNAKIADVVEECHDDYCLDNLPGRVMDRLETDCDEDDVDIEGADDERVYCTREVQVTIGLFTIIKLARIVQLLIPAFAFCIPEKTCVASTDDEPCELFDTIEFPVEEFFPPQKEDYPGAIEEEVMLREDMGEEA